MERLLIVGGGLVGPVLAVYLARRGHRVEVYDRHADPRRERVGGRRPSINLTLCERGLRALAGVGVSETVLGMSVPAYGRMIHSTDGSVTFQPYGNNHEAIYSISRADLNEALIDFAEQHTGISFNFGKKCVGLDLSTATAHFEDEVTKHVSTVRSDRVFGADGAYSAVRLQRQKSDLFNYSQQYWSQGYKELHIPANADGKWALESNALHIWPRGGYMLIGFPNRDGSFTCSLHISFTGERSYESIASEAELLAFFEESFPDTLELMPSLVNDFFSKPPNSMLTMRCDPWSYLDKMLLVGDAAHAILPSYGQGANAGFEDCAILDRCIEEQGGDWGAVFRDFESLRRPDMEAMADLCIEHFVELRDLVGDPRFLLRKQIERKVHELYPELYVPLYSRITFSSMPYAQAERVEREQRVLIDRIMCLERIEDEIAASGIEGVIASFIRESEESAEDKGGCFV